MILRENRTSPLEPKLTGLRELQQAHRRGITLFSRSELELLEKKEKKQLLAPGARALPPWVAIAVTPAGQAKVPVIQQ